MPYVDSIEIFYSIKFLYLILRFGMDFKRIWYKVEHIQCFLYTCC
jgi:hypothetical protein